MAPLIVQVVTWGLLFLAGTLGSMPPMGNPVEALRVSLATMFVFTAVSHFTPQTRADLLKMAPPSLPMPGLLVTITGILEAAGAMGLVTPGWHRAAAISLALLLVALFPANIHAARAGVVIAGRRAMSLIPRLTLQLYWIACLCWVALRAITR